MNMLVSFMVDTILTPLSFSSLFWANMFTGGRYCNSTTNHHVRSWKGDWFHQTIHVTGNFNHDQEAGQEESWNLLVHESSFARNLDVYHPVLLWSLGCHVPCLPLLTPWMEIRRNINWSFNFKWLFSLQQPLVLSWSNHATELWRLPQVWHRKQEAAYCSVRCTLRPSFFHFSPPPSHFNSANFRNKSWIHLQTNKVKQKF